MVITFTVILVLIVPSALLAKENTPVTHPCKFNLEEICGFQSLPSTQTQIYHARMCLGSNSNILAGDCHDYLQYEVPSFVEACSSDILAYCKDLPIVIDDIQTCLKERGKETSIQCREALERHGNTDILAWPQHNPKHQILPELFNSHSLFAPLLKERANEIAEEDIPKEIEAPEVPLNEIVSEMNHKIASLRKRIV